MSESKTQNNGYEDLNLSAFQRFIFGAIENIINFSGVIGGTSIFLCALIINLEIVLRTFFNSPTIWAFELSIYLFMVFVFSCMASVQAKDKHIKVDLLTSSFSQRTRAIWDIVTLSFGLLFAVLLTFYGYEFASKSFLLRELSPSYWAPPIWPFKAFLPIGALFLSVQYLKDIFISIKRFNNTYFEEGCGSKKNPYFIALVFFGLILFSLFLFKYSPVVAFIILLLTLLFFGVHIFVSLGLVGVVGLYMVMGGSKVLITLPKIAFSSMDNFSIICIPLFVLCGEILNRGGAGQELYDTAAKWLENVKGGLAVATVVACAAFAAISASSVATAFTIGLVSLHVLKKHGYDKSLSAGALAAGGTLGIIIPPSGSMIIYSSVTEESLGKLFIAGIIPGLILLLTFSIYIIFYQTCYEKKHLLTKKSKTTLKGKVSSVYTAKWSLLAPIIVIGGILAGIFTPLEASAVAVVYSFLMVLARRKISLREVPMLLNKSSIGAVSILVIVMGAMVMGYFMTIMNLPNLVIDGIVGTGLPRWGILIMLMIGFMIMGMFLEVISIMLITLPVVYPLIISLGYDGIWFAVLMTINMELALITPPIGLNLFVIQGIDNTPYKTILKGTWPFFLLMLLVLIIVAVFPSLSTWLPSVVMD